MKINKQFNRKESEFEHYYFKNYGFEGNSHQQEYKGRIKCKLVHTNEISLIIPDFIFLSDGSTYKWIQPLSFLACHLYKHDSVVICVINIDISCGVSIEVKFNNGGYVEHFNDGSQLYECTITGCDDLKQYCTGFAEFDLDNIPSISLFHHTPDEIKPLILNDSSFKLSQWNIQGTRKLKNAGYSYFTALDRIEMNNDLIEIAMSNNGKIHLITDNIPIPSIIDENWFDENKDNALTLEVYRESTSNRTSVIDVLLDTTLLSPQHIYRHFYPECGVYYEICNPFIHRVGLSDSSKRLEFDNGRIIKNDKIINSNYIIIGDCLTIKGLESPYDEENTEYIFKIQKLDKYNFLDFWFDNSNQDHFSDKKVDLIELA